MTSTDLSVEQPRPQCENVCAAGEGQGGVGIYHRHLEQVLGVLEVHDGGVEEDVVDVDFLGMPKNCQSCQKRKLKNYESIFCYTF